MKIEINLTEEDIKHMDNASILCACDWDEDMASSAQHVVELVYRKVQKQKDKAGVTQLEE